MEFVGTLKLSTITDPGVNLDRFIPRWEKFLSRYFIPLLKKKVKFIPFGKPTLFPILKSGPTSLENKVNSSAIALIASARLWVRMGPLWDTFKSFASQLGVPALGNRIEMVASASDLDVLDNEYFEHRHKLYPSLDNPTVSDKTGGIVRYFEEIEKNVLFKSIISFAQRVRASISFIVNLMRTGKRHDVENLTVPLMIDLLVLIDKFIIFLKSRKSFYSSCYRIIIKAISNLDIPAIGISQYVELEPPSPNVLFNANRRDWKIWYPASGYLGKLGLKLEAAGKIRVFAMVDAWTQWVMAPLHDYIFNILKGLKVNDGTFDQLRPLRTLQVQFLGEKAIGHTFSSIDLSAATDRLPLALQKSLLKSLLLDVVPDSKLFAEAWGDLLVKRAYMLSIPSQVRKGMIISSTLPKSVMYAIGQPMGALSSWAMLAITHHAIIQFAAQRAGWINWFPNYAVLGDDVVIMDADVANCYRQILRDIAVGAGMAKSIIAKSKFVCEFAKKFFVGSTQADMLPLKECIATRLSTSLVLEFVRKYNLTLNSILAFLGFGYKARIMAISSLLWDLSNRLRVLLVWLSHPNSPIGVRTREEYNLYPFTVWLFQSKWLTPFGTVTHGNLCEVNGLLHSLLWRKNCDGEAILTKYEKSAFEFVNKVDKQSPIYLNISAPFSTDSMNAIPQLYSWSNLIKSKVVDVGELENYLSNISGPVGFEDVLFYTNNINQPITSAELGKHLRPARDPFMRSVDLGIKPYTNPDLLVNVDYEALDQFINSKPSDYVYQISELIKDHGNDNPLILLGIETMLQDLFLPHIHKSLIPTEFWGECMPQEKPFRDFLQIFELWVKLSKRTWSEHYRNVNRALPIQFLDPKKVMNIVTDQVKPCTAVGFVRDCLSLTYIEIPCRTKTHTNNKWVDMFLEGSIRKVEVIISDFVLLCTRVLRKYSSIIISRILFSTVFTNMLSGENVKFGLELLAIPSFEQVKGYKNQFVSILNSVISICSNIYRILNWIIDFIVLVIMLVVIGELYWSLDDPIDWELSWLDNSGTSDKPSSRAIYFIGGAILVLVIYWVGFDLYSSYQTNLNYIDPAIQPLYLPAYAGIPEVIPSGLGRGEIISIFEPTTLGPISSELLLSPVSPYQMYGFWE